MSLVGFQASNHPQQIDPWNERFGGFTLDVAAAPHNAKCDRYYTIEDDGLAQSWASERVWCNPPYSNLYAWVTKAWGEYRTSRGIVMLLPANRPEQRWWQELVEPYRDRPGSPLRVEFLAGRMRFIKEGQTAIGPNERPPFGCCLLIWSKPTSRCMWAVEGECGAGGCYGCEHGGTGMGKQ